MTLVELKDHFGRLQKQRESDKTKQQNEALDSTLRNFRRDQLLQRQGAEKSLLIEVGVDLILDNIMDFILGSILGRVNLFHYYYFLLLFSKYHHVRFVNLSISSLGIFGQSCNSFIQMCTDLSINTGHSKYIITKLTSIIIRTIYYIFCMRNKPWTNPDLLSY